MQTIKNQPKSTEEIVLALNCPRLSRARVSTRARAHVCVCVCLCACREGDLATSSRAILSDLDFERNVDQIN